MPRLVQANEATASRRRVYFHLVDATDGISVEVSEAAGQPQISSDGGAWTNTGIGTLTSIGNGRYFADLTQAAVATGGTNIETRYKSANTAECPGDSVQVVAFPLLTAATVTLAAATHTGAVIPTVTTLTGHTAQTGDSFAVVNSATFGNARLVRATTPANTLDVNATGGAEIDLAQVVAPRDVSALTTMNVGDCLAGARWVGAGGSDITGTVETHLNPDGTVYRTFALNSATAPTNRS